MNEFKVGDIVRIKEDVWGTSTLPSLIGTVNKVNSFGDAFIGVKVNGYDPKNNNSGVLFFSQDELTPFEEEPVSVDLDSLVRRYAEALDEIVAGGTYSAPYTGLGIFYEFLREVKEL